MSNRRNFAIGSCKSRAGVVVLISAAMLLVCALANAEETTNRLASNRLASNRLASNALAGEKLATVRLQANSDTAELLGTADGREVYSYIISCALALNTR